MNWYGGLLMTGIYGGAAATIAVFLLLAKWAEKSSLGIAMLIIFAVVALFLIGAMATAT